MSRIIELVWDCAECGTNDIKGRHKVCTQCGAPRENAELRQATGTETDGSGYNPSATVTDPELLRLARAGADWHCKHCASGNMNGDDTCRACGAPRHDVVPDRPKTRPAPKRKPANVIVPAVQPDVTPPEPSTPSLSPKEKWGIGIVMGAAAIFGIVLVSTTKTIPSQLESATWSHTTHVERWTDYTLREWSKDVRLRPPSIPTNDIGVPGMTLNLGTCKEEEHHKERYVCGSHKECEPIYKRETERYPCTKSETYTCGEVCKSNDNGFATCRPKHCTRQVPDTCTRSVQVKTGERCENVPNYCYRPIYEEKCTYTSQRWEAVDQATVSGNGADWRWADAPITLTNMDRLRYSGSYKVTIAYRDYVLYDDGFRSTDKIAAANEAGRYTDIVKKASDGVDVSVNVFGHVLSAKP